jgi:hypothetical protein
MLPRSSAPLLLLVAGALTVATSCKQETSVTVGLPILAEPPSSIDFGEVNVGEDLIATWTMKNTGIADLVLSSVEYTGDPEITLESYPDVVPPNSEGEIKIRFAPEAEGGASGVITVTTNDPAWDVFTIKVGGVGVVARLEISPQSLWFGDVGFGSSFTQATTLTSWGSGTVEIKDLEFPAGEGIAYSWKLPGDAKLPYFIPPGTAAVLDITYTPPLDEHFSGQLVVHSNDIDVEYQGIGLYAGEGGGGKLPPEIDILAPGWGTRWIEGQPVALVAHAIDGDTPPEQLVVFVTIDGLTAPYVGIPDSKGTVIWSGSETAQITGLTAGNHTIGVKAIDPENHSAEAFVDVTLDPDHQLFYTVTGGESIFDYFRVDDDMEVVVNGVTVYVDSSGATEPSSAPFQFEAKVGDVIEIRASDVNPCAREVSDLWLHFGTASSERMVAAQSLSGTGGVDDCVGRDDYDPAAYQPPPYTFLDVSHTITIP